LSSYISQHLGFPFTPLTPSPSLSLFSDAAALPSHALHPERRAPLPRPPPLHSPSFISPGGGGGALLGHGGAARAGRGRRRGVARAEGGRRVEAARTGGGCRGGPSSTRLQRRDVVSIHLQRRPRRRICPGEGVSGPGEGVSGPGGSTASIRPPVAPRRESTSGAPLSAAGGPVDGGSGEVELKASSHRIPAALGFR